MNDVKDVLYSCDGKRCETCHPEECKHTLEREHAMHKDSLVGCVFTCIAGKDGSLALKEIELPERKNLAEILNRRWGDNVIGRCLEQQYAQGWNNCLDAIQEANKG